MSRVLVVGGGASGLVASIYASNGGNEVILIDKNNNLGKKILMTGNGKCNYWNRDISLKHYNSSDLDVLDKIITDKNKLEIENFFDRIGIIPKVKDMYYYPASNQATSIQTALILECELCGVKIFNNEEVYSVTKNDNYFEVVTSERKLVVDKVILAMGSKAGLKNNNLSYGYDICSSFGHNIVMPLPGLVQLRTKGNFLREWHGVRSDVKVSLYENGLFVKDSVGEIQLTDYGVSGVCVFQLSSLVSRGLFNSFKEEIEINFLNNLGIDDEEGFMLFFDERNNKVINRNISQLLDGILNYKLINMILKLLKINKDGKWEDLSIERKRELGKCLTKFRLEIIETNSFEYAQVCSGGVRLNEINSYTMESLCEAGLYIVGELLDVDGECGGFNLGFAWITGYLAGISTWSDSND